MSESEQPEQKSGHDSRLDAFLRESRAVIATEKGMTTAAQTKIKSIADRLNLPAELYETGLLELQDSGTPLGDLTRYEKAFLAFLEKEFNKILGGVLSIRMEENAIERAQRKFNIPKHRADQLIDFQATQSGVGRLARADALRYGEQAIADKVGESLVVSFETETACKKLGRRWGLSDEQVDEVLLKTLGRNRAKAKALRRKRITKWVGWVCATVVIGGAAGFAYQWIANKINNEPVANHPNDDPTPIDQSTLMEDDSLDNKWILNGLLQIAPTLIPKFASDQPSVRQDAYKEMTRIVFGDSKLTSANQKQAVELLGEVYFTEPDDVAAGQILESIDASLADRRSQTVRSLKATYPANRLAALVYGYRDKGETFVNHQQRKRHLSKMLFNRTGYDLESLSFAEYIQSSEQALAIEQWNGLIQNSWTSPARSAVLVESLNDLTADKLEPSTREQFRTRSLHTILEADRNSWRDLKQPIASAVKASDEVGVIDWIAVFETGNVAFREFLGPKLATKVGLDPTARFSDLEKELKAVRGSYRNRMLGSVLARNKQIDELMEKFLQREAAAGSVTPDFIAQAISLGNLSMESCQIINSGQARDEMAYESLDESLVDYSKRLRDVVFLDDQKRENQGVAATASLGESETKSRVISRLKDLSRDNRALRISGLDQLGRAAKKFPDISYEEAFVLATYLYSELDTEELLEAQQDVSSFNHWTNLLLAASDVIAQSNVDIDQALTISNLLTNVRFEIGRSDNWRENLSWQLFSHARESLAESKIDPNSVSGDWSRLRKLVVRRYRERLSLAGKELLQSNASPVELLSKLLQSGNEFSDGLSSNQQYDRAMELVRRLSDNEIEQIVLLNRLLIEKEANRLRSMSAESASEVDSIFSRFELQMKRDSDLGTRLLFTESCLARLSSLERRVATEQLMERF